MEAKHLEIDHCKVFYDLYPCTNPKSTLTLINGHTRSSSDFRMIARKLSEKGYLIIAPDNRASGRSLCEQPFEFQQFLKDVSAIWEAEHISDTSVLGISMGGLIALGLCGLFPNKVKKAIVTSSFCQQINSTKPPVPWGTSAESVAAKLRPYFSENFSSRNPLLLNAMVKAILKSIESGKFSNQAQLQRDALRSLDLSKELPGYPQDFLFIHGKEDYIVPYQNSVEMDAAVGSSKLMLYEGVGHLILAEAPDKFFQDVHAFLEE